MAEPDAVRSVISLTGQFAALEPNLTARENLVLVARLRGHGRGAAARIVDGLIDRFDIGEFAGKLDQVGLGRPAPAGRPRGQPRRPAPAAGPRRADNRARPAEPPGRCGRRCASWWPRGHRAAHHPVPGGGRRAGRPHRGHGPRPGGRDRDPGPAEGPDRRPAGRRGGRRRGGLRPARRRPSGSGSSAGVDAERRTISVPAPRARPPTCSRSPRSSPPAARSVDEVALRRPTLDDAFLALTGEPRADDPIEELAMEVSA